MSGRKGAGMGFSLGNILKGAVNGVETLLETGNPVAAAGAAALIAVSGGQAASGPTYDPLLDEMSASLNPGSPPQIYSYSQIAGLDQNGNSTRSQAPNLGPIVDGDDDADDSADGA